MSIHKKKSDFLISKDGVQALEDLQAMVASDEFCTDSSYTTNSTVYADNLIPFADKHILYLQDHLNVEPDKYIANLKLMSRLKISTTLAA